MEIIFITSDLIIAFATHILVQLNQMEGAVGI